MTLKQQKIDFARNSLEGIFDDNRLVNEILFQYFYKQVKYMNKKEFKEHLIDLNIIEDEEDIEEEKRLKDRDDEIRWNKPFYKWEK